MIYPKQNYEQWLQDFMLYKMQHAFAAEQCSTYEHLLATQSTAGNLPKALEKWAVLRTNCIRALELHLDRGLRWQVLTNERHHQLLDEVEQLKSKAV